MIYLLDTNVVAELTTRVRPDPRVVAWLRSTPRPNRFLSVITVAEIEAGVTATPDPARRARYAEVLAAARWEYRDRIAPIGEREAAAYLAVHKTLKAAGAGIDPPDALIAATALANGWTVASRNTKHLKRTGAAVLNPWEFDL
ncbi:type II toxin-antitoxin system VapC family toxin [Actinacidiphila sp. DG2A-62]|uniref:type II toxin-antitoxin system VapC family toxin n=1 Tax=Actinacidiphila sp. DG2A-62 TaxID=3108821 RepID=UPI002DBF7C82|nr:type II toxin-antitoxin system VapC family toxin [Actinacidiphila sp. DG2A-62]MEC3993705.1 type II toxin-antitoxin system VapC family toxin [Actinacidiphila sp. DG2A-62]